MVSWFHDRKIKWQHTDTRLHDVGGWCLNFLSGCVFIKESLPKIFVNWSVILLGHFSSFSFIWPRSQNDRTCPMTDRYLHH